MSDLHKIIIFEIANNRVWRLFFPLYANTYMVNTSNIYTTIADTDFDFEYMGLIINLPILAFYVDKEPYRRVDTIAECVGDELAGEKTFHYNDTSKDLYVHFEGGKRPYNFATAQIELGVSAGYYNSASDWDGVTSNQQYKSRLISSSLYKDKKDDQYNAKQVFQTANAVLDNSDFNLSPFAVGPDVIDKTGAYARTRIWAGNDLEDATEANFKTVNQSVVESISEGANINIKMKDIRSTLDLKSPTRVLNNASWPSLKDGDKDHIIPESWGKVYGVKCLCLNENANKDIIIGSWVDFKFLLCDASAPQTASNRGIDASAIKAVYINGTQLTTAQVSTINATLTSASGEHVYTISNTLFRVDDGSGNIKLDGMSEVIVDFYGYEKSGVLIDNGMEILENIIYDNYAWPYTETFYNKTVWDANKATFPDMGFHFTKPVTVQDKAQKIAGQNLDKFEWGVDLRFTWDTDDFDGTYQATITDDEFFGESFIPSVTRNASNVLSSFRIGYRPKSDESKEELKYTWVTDDSYAAEALALYRSTTTRDFPTNLTDLTEIAALQTRVHAISDTPDDRFSCTIPWQYLSELRSGDWVLMRINLPQRDFVGWVRANIVSISPDSTKYGTVLSVRIFEYFKNVYYDGKKLIYNGREVIR